MVPVSVVGTWLIFSVNISFCFYFLLWFYICHLFLSSLGLIKFFIFWFGLIQFCCLSPLPELYFSSFVGLNAPWELSTLRCATLGPHPQLSDSAHVREAQTDIQTNLKCWIIPTSLAIFVYFNLESCNRS